MACKETPGKGRCKGSQVPKGQQDLRRLHEIKLQNSQGGHLQPSGPKFFMCFMSWDSFVILVWYLCAYLLAKKELTQNQSLTSGGDSVARTQLHCRPKRSQRTFQGAVTKMPQGQTRDAMTIGLSSAEYPWQNREGGRDTISEDFANCCIMFKTSICEHTPCWRERHLDISVKSWKNVGISFILQATTTWWGALLNLIVPHCFSRVVSSGEFGQTRPELLVKPWPSKSGTLETINALSVAARQVRRSGPGPSAAARNLN